MKKGNLIEQCPYRQTCVRSVVVLVYSSIGPFGDLDKHDPMGGSFPFLEPMKLDIRERFLRIPEIVPRTGMSKTTVYNRINQEFFPKQIPIGANLVVWLERDIQEWMQ